MNGKAVTKVRISGTLQVRAATMAKARRDYTSLNHALLALWAGNQSHGGHRIVDGLPPAELRDAIKEGRLRLVVDPKTR